MHSKVVAELRGAVVVLCDPEARAQLARAVGRAPDLVHQVGLAVPGGGAVLCHD